MGDVVLYVIAALALVWVLVPAVVFSLGGARLRKALHRDPARAEPRADDPDHARRFQQFTELGFRPVGVTRETCWFMNPTKWYWHALDWSRWMELPDGRMLVSFHRLLASEPVRFGVVTLFDDGGLVRTTCPGIGRGMKQVTKNALRFELKNVEPAELVAKHEEHVAAFVAAGNRKIKQAIFEEVTAAETAKDRVVLSGRKGSYQLLALYFAYRPCSGAGCWRRSARPPGTGARSGCARARRSSRSNASCECPSGDVRTSFVRIPRKPAASGTCARATRPRSSCCRTIVIPKRPRNSSGSGTTSTASTPPWAAFAVSFAAKPDRKARRRARTGSTAVRGA